MGMIWCRPGPGEVPVSVLAAGVSFTDTLICAGTYLGGPKPPFTPGHGASAGHSPQAAHG